MQKFKFVYKNCGPMRLGYDISKIEIMIERNNFKGDITIEMSTMKIEIKDKMYSVLNKEHGIVPNNILDKLEKIKLPKEKSYDCHGYDGFAWEMEFDDEKYHGYIVEPDFYKKVIKIIEIKKIFDYCHNKIDNYLN